jgi:hypothetical protein
MYYIIYILLLITIIDITCIEEFGTDVSGKEFYATVSSHDSFCCHIGHRSSWMMAMAM